MKTHAPTPSEDSSREAYVLFEREQAQELVTRANQYDAITKIVQQLYAIREPEQLLHQATTLLQLHFDLQAVRVYLLNEVNDAQETIGEFILQASLGETAPSRDLDEKAIPLDEAQHPVIRAALYREPVATECSDASSRPTFELAVPLAIDDQTLGVLSLQRPLPFSPLDRATLDLLAAQISAALQNARLFQQARTTNEKLRETNEQQNQFLVRLSHELRTFLYSVMGYSEAMLIGIDGPVQPNLLDSVQVIHANSQSLLSSVESINDVVKVTPGRDRNGVTPGP